MSPEQIREALAAYFPADVVQSRPGAKTKDGKKALVFFYIDARAVMDRLDDVFGVGGWKDEYQIALDKNIVICRISVKIDGEWIGKEDVGVHSSTGDKNASEDNLDMKYKGVFSDSFKRCAVKWNIGRYLYNIPEAWAALNEWGNAFDRNNSPKLPPQFLPKSAESLTSQSKSAESLTSQSKKAADWIVAEYTKAKTRDDILKVDAVVKDRNATAILMPQDQLKVNTVRAGAWTRTGDVLHTPGAP